MDHELHLQDEFIAGILNQLYMNREKHKKHHDRDIHFMYEIGNEQYGQLGGAIALDDIERQEQEIYHTAAILYELLERVENAKKAILEN